MSRFFIFSFSNSATVVTAPTEVLIFFHMKKVKMHRRSVNQRFRSSSGLRKMQKNNKSKTKRKKASPARKRYTFTLPEQLPEGLLMDVQEDFHQFGMSLKKLVETYPSIHPNVIAAIL